MNGLVVCIWLMLVCYCSRLLHVHLSCTFNGLLVGNLGGYWVGFLIGVLISFFLWCVHVVSYGLIRQIYY